jgi:hypothetical protein
MEGRVHWQHGICAILACMWRKWEGREEEEEEV